MVRFTSTIAAAAATLLASVPFILADAPEGTVKYTFERRRVSARDAPPGLSKRQSNTVNVGIDNAYLLYVINTTVGTPGQPIILQLDTGSSDIWFPSSSAQVCQQGYCTGGSYNAANSRTSATIPEYGTFEIAYVDGTQVAGEYISDTMTIGGTTISNLTMASATQTERGLGIMGIGFQLDESSNSASGNGFTYPNIINQLQAQGKINTLSYSLWLDDLEGNTGSILFGGVDKSKYTGSLAVLPIQKDSMSGQYSSFTVAWTGLTITGSGNNVNLSPSAAQPAILDSGTSLLYVPNDIANSIYNGVGVISDATYGNVVPCKMANDDLTFSFQFGGSSGPTIKVGISEFVVPIVTTDNSTPRFRNGDTVCQFGIEAAGSDPILFGDTFLRSAYVVYDLDNLEIGLAQSNFNSNSGTGNVQAFSSGAGIPGASTTVSGATVAQTYTGRPLITVGGTQSAAATAGVGGSSRTASFHLSTAAASGATSSASSTHNASPGRIETDRSVFAVFAVTLGAFFFGVMLV